MSSKHAKVAAAVVELKNVVLADAELVELARAAKTPGELASLWSNPRFREAHDRAITGISTEDVRGYLSELNDDQLDGVTGGALNAYATLTLNGTARELYAAALQQALAPSLY